MNEPMPKPPEMPMFCDDMIRRLSEWRLEEWRKELTEWSKRRASTAKGGEKERAGDEPAPRSSE